MRRYDQWTGLPVAGKPSVDIPGLILEYIPQSFSLE
jgi:hypothetical protein